MRNALNAQMCMCSVCSVCSVRCPYSGHLFIMSTSERLTQQTAHTAHMSSVRVSRHVQNRFMSIFIPMIHYQFVVRYDIRVHCLLMTLPENVRCTNRSFVVLVNTTTENCADIRRRIDLPWERNSENTQQKKNRFVASLLLQFTDGSCRALALHIDDRRCIWWMETSA